MKKVKTAIRLWPCIAAVVLAACGRAEERKPPPPVDNRAQPAVPAPATGPDSKTPLGPVAPAVDPKSPDAAAGVVTDFANLLKARRYGEAHDLWSGDSTSDAAFAAKFRGYEIEGAAIGRPGAPEGAAGSIYVEVPLTLFFAKGDETGALSGKVTLRRVNDVPGSTAEQRRWHIVNTDLKPAG